jgi:hypothetical protein
MELEMSGLGRMAMSRLTVITVEDIGTGAPLLPVYIAAAWRCYMDLQDPQSSKFNAAGAKAKLMEAAYTVSVVHGNHMTCSAGHAGTVALKVGNTTSLLVPVVLVFIVQAYDRLVKG